MIPKNFISVIVPIILATLVSMVLNIFTPLRSAHWQFSIIYFTVYCVAANLIYTRTVRRDTLTGQLMAGVVIKLLLGLVCIVIYKVIAPEDFPAFAIHFLIHYILFTIFEIRYLLYLVKKLTVTQPDNK
jgi:hypothetical protein